MKTVLLPSGLTCRPLRLRSIFSGISEFRDYSQCYGYALRISAGSGETYRDLWQRNPYIVSSVIPGDLAEYNEEIHPVIVRKSGQSIREAAAEMRENMSQGE